jgi:hypothetical protein
MERVVEISSPTQRQADPPSIHDVVSRFEHALREQDLFASLRFLNSTTTYRFTGVYCFEPGLVRSVLLYDRQNPNLRIGQDVPWFDSYCMLTAENGAECQIENALNDARLGGHAARQTVLAYCAVLLRTPEGDELGTLCHYDVSAKTTAPGVFDGLRACRPIVERCLWEMNIHRRALPRD